MKTVNVCVCLFLSVLYCSGVHLCYVLELICVFCLFVCVSVYFVCLCVSVCVLFVCVCPSVWVKSV